MRVFRLLPLLCLLTAAPAAAQQVLTGEEARAFVAGKLFAYSCFDGTRGAGRIFADGAGKLYAHASVTCTIVTPEEKKEG